MPRKHWFLRGATERGFTLVEMMVVVVIIGILATLASGSFARQDSSTATSGLAREIYALANQARMTAITSQRQVWLRLQPLNPAAQLRAALIVGNGAIGAGQWGPADQTVISHQTALVVGVAVGAMMNSAPPTAVGGAVDVVFFPNGTVQIPGMPSTGATIYVADSQLSNRMRVVIFGRTGFAKVLTQ